MKIATPANDNHNAKIKIAQTKSILSIIVHTGVVKKHRTEKAEPTMKSSLLMQ